MEENKIITETTEATETADKKFCTSCGAELHPEAVMCPACSAAQEIADTAKKNWFKRLIEKFKANKKFRIGVICGLVAFVLILAAGIGMIIYNSSSNDTSTISTRDTLHNAVQSRAFSYCYFKYEGVKSVNVNIGSYKNISSSLDTAYTKYSVYGYVTVYDNYGDTYKAKFEAVVSVDQNGKGTCSSYSMDTPTKS